MFLLVLSGTYHHFGNPQKNLISVLMSDEYSQLKQVAYLIGLKRI